MKANLTKEEILDQFNHHEFQDFDMHYKKGVSKIDCHEAMRTYATQQVRAVLTECVSELGEGITMFSKERYRELLERTEKG